MLPSEAALMAAGWPKGAGPHGSVDEGDEGARPSSREPARSNRGARLLHLARRAERTLLSYERSGWLDDEPCRVTNVMEMRPAAEQGPIILCLDTSASMSGPRERVAKALALEVLRGAHRQGRQAYLYAFSGPQQVEEIELKAEASNLNALLTFLSNSFSGGTDVDRPLALSLERLRQKGWERADILMVTDGEIPGASPELLSGIREMSAEHGLEVHGMLVGSRVTDQMEELCSQIHLFESWSVVEGAGRSRLS